MYNCGVESGNEAIWLNVRKHLHTHAYRRHLGVLELKGVLHRIYRRHLGVLELKGVLHRIYRRHLGVLELKGVLHRILSWMYLWLPCVHSETDYFFQFWAFRIPLLCKHSFLEWTQVWCKTESRVLPLWNTEMVYKGNMDTSVLRTLCYVPYTCMLSSCKFTPEMRTSPGPQGVHNRGVPEMRTPLYIGHFTSSPRCPQ